MKKLFVSLGVSFLINLPCNLPAETLLYDDFIGIVSPDKWHIPTWVSSTDGTFVGQTQFRCTQNSPLPQAINSNAIITVESYNPTALPDHPSFYGTDLISNLSVPRGQGIHLTVRAKMDTSTPGIVGGIFLYALRPEDTNLHDEIDFELLTTRPYEAQINIYSNEELGTGHPQFINYASGSIYDYHTYEIKWQPYQVSWYIDGILVMTDTDHVPAGPMNLHLNSWVPDSGWPAAYNPDIKPATLSSSNQVFWMSVDSVKIQTIPPAPGTTGLPPVLHLLLLDNAPGSSQ